MNETLRQVKQIVKETKDDVKWLDKHANLRGYLALTGIAIAIMLLLSIIPIVVIFFIIP